MNDFKERIVNVGLKHSKIAELLGVTRQHLCRCLNERTFISVKRQFQLDKILINYEQAQKNSRL